MNIRSMELKCFRNYRELSVEFSPGINVLYGENAQGKTNILEAAYLCGTSKSHKGSKDRDMILFGQDEAHIRTVVNKKNSVYQIDLHLKKHKSKGIAINKVPIKRAGELFGVLNLIFFSPEDLGIIKNGPSERRRFMDSELCQLDPIYLSELSKYNKALAQRNRLLKEIERNPELKSTIPMWNQTLIQYGKKIIRRRDSFVRDLGEIIKDIHRDLSGGREAINICYEPDTRAEAFEEALILREDRDLRSCQTSAGPHRDDISFKINDIDIRHFGSQGQQRTAALSLKLAEIELMKSLINDTPVLLLDDVLSELDHNRQNYLLRRIGDIQTVITCTGLDEFVKNNVAIDRIFNVKDGMINV